MKALITGASSGIGRAIALRLAHYGYGLIVTARREERLEELKGVVHTGVTAIPADLSKREDCFALYERVKGEDIHVFVNNAGLGVYGPFQETNLARELRMLDVNITAMHILMKLFQKDFMQKDYGYILNVSSSAAFLPGPLFSSYYASKAYGLRLTQAVREELRREGSNVYVGALCPGPVRTEFGAAADVTKSFEGLGVEEVAYYAVEQMFRKKGVIVPGAQMKLARFWDKVLPDSLLARISYGLQNKKRGG